MPRFILVVSSMILLALGSCEKAQKHFLIDPNFKPYFSFRNGSTWIYYLASDSSVKQTVTSQNYLEGKMTWDALDQEFIEFNLHSDKDSIYKVRVIADDNDVNRAVWFVRDTFFKKNMEFYSAFGVLAGVKGSGDSFTYHASYITEGKSYNDVLELRPLNSIIFRKIYLAKGIGIIRKEMLSGEVYVLKSYSLQ